MHQSINCSSSHLLKCSRLLAGKVSLLAVLCSHVSINSVNTVSLSDGLWTRSQTQTFVLQTLVAETNDRQTDFMASCGGMCLYFFFTLKPNRVFFYSVTVGSLFQLHMSALVSEVSVDSKLVKTRQMTEKMKPLLHEHEELKL